MVKCLWPCATNYYGRICFTRMPKMSSIKANFRYFKSTNNMWVCTFDFELGNQHICTVDCGVAEHGDFKYISIALKDSGQAESVREIISQEQYDLFKGHL
ncbi:hypothetical protein SO802_025997 [Lithocarpus litseifolius]|uniref:Uncharacterized protein n=1 Tax=Lithocarpus litseifolius TaxID=425828 RepID=A0AAW2C093_9ROSI